MVGAFRVAEGENQPAEWAAEVTWGEPGQPVVAPRALSFCHPQLSSIFFLHLGTSHLDGDLISVTRRKGDGIS